VIGLQADTLGVSAVPTAIAAQPLRDFAQPSSKKSRIPELDGLRGLAIAFVVIFHYFYFGPSTNQHLSVARSLYVHFEQIIALGWSGVDLFFVLSGFLIGGILMDVQASEHYFKTFYLRRFFRIIPIYYLWILSFLVVATVAGSFVRAHTAGELPYQKDHIIPLLLFLQNFGFMNYSVLAGAWFLPTWSLAVEEQFYRVSPLVIRLLTRRALYAFLGLVIFLAPPLRLLIYYHVPARPNELSLAYTLMPCRADALALGMVAAGLWRNVRFRLWVNGNTAVPYSLAAILLAGLLIMGRWFPSHEALQTVCYTWIDLLYVLILLLALAKRNGPIARIARIGWLGELGRVSYCLYIVHTGIRLMCQVFIAAALNNHVRSWEGIAGNGLAAVLSYAIARFSWTYFEHPLLKKGHAFEY
jgi:peptidoglycan/LPS O-acetylase OafA/YrhL